MRKKINKTRNIILTLVITVIIIAGGVFLNMNPELFSGNLFRNAPKSSISTNVKVAETTTMAPIDMNAAIREEEKEEMVLKVNVNIEKGSFVITNNRNLVVGNKKATECDYYNWNYSCDFRGFDNGNYTITFNEVFGYAKPEDKTITLSKNIEIFGKYEMERGIDENTVDNIIDNTIETGRYTDLTVGVNILEGNFRIMDAGGSIVQEAGGSNCPYSNGYYSCTYTLESSTYSIDFLDVNGYVSPTDKIVILEGGEEEVLRDYEEDVIYSNLKVGVNIREGAFELTDATGHSYGYKSTNDLQYEAATGYSIYNYTNLPLGMYVINFYDTNDYITPNSINVQLDEDGENIYGYYSMEQ